MIVLSGNSRLTFAKKSQSAWPEYFWSTLRAWTQIAATPASNAPPAIFQKASCALVRRAERPAKLDRDRPVGDGVDDGPDDLQRQAGIVHHVAAALLRDHLADRTGEVEIDDVESQFAQAGRRLGHGRGSGAHDLAGDRVVGVVEPGHLAAVPDLDRDLPVEHGFRRACRTPRSERQIRRKGRSLYPASAARTTGNSISIGPILIGDTIPISEFRKIVPWIMTLDFPNSGNWYCVP